MAIRHDNSFRASGAYSLVSARKKGLPPSGSTMGKSALRTRNRLFAASSIGSVIFSLSVIYFNWCPLEAAGRIALILIVAEKLGISGVIDFSGCQVRANKEWRSG